MSARKLSSFPKIQTRVPSLSKDACCETFRVDSAGRIAKHSSGAAIVAPLYTTAYLQHLCNSPYDVDAGLCAGYIMGVADTLQQQHQACLSPNISPETLVDNIRRAWEQSPTQPESALNSIQDIFLKRFPCP
jgi:hypothetical protein